MWALGATLYALVFGNVPFVASSIPVLYEKIKTEELSFPEIPRTSVELRDCIQSMLQKKPADRITIPQLKVSRLFERVHFHKVFSWRLNQLLKVRVL